MPREGKLFHYSPADQMLLNDALQHLGCGRVIPHALGVHQRDRPLLANPQTVRLRTIHSIEQSQLGQPPLEKIPRLEPHFLRATLRLRLVAAEEDVTADAGNVQSVRDLNQAFEIGHTREDSLSQNRVHDLFADVRSNRVMADPNAISIFTAVQALGLKLEPQKASIEILIIDHVEKPSDN